MILTLALLGACAEAPLDAAPEVDAASERAVLSTQDRLKALEVQTAALTKQLQAAQTQIAALQTENKDQTAQIEALTVKQKIIENATGQMRDAVTGIVVSGFDPEPGFEDLDPVTLAVQSKDAAKMTVKFKPEYTRKVLALESSSARHDTILGDLALVDEAISDYIDDGREAYGVARIELAHKKANTSTADDWTKMVVMPSQIGQLQAAIGELEGDLYETDATGARVSKIEALTIKQKVTENAVGEMRAFEGYTGAIASASLEYLLAAARGPGRQGGHMTVLEDYQVKLAGLGVPAGPSGTTDELMQALFETNPETGEEVVRVDGSGLALAARMRKRPEVLYQAWDDTLNDYLNEIQNNPVYTDAESPHFNPLFGLQNRVTGLETSVANFVDDWQGEVAYLKVQDQMLWTASHDQRERIGKLEGETAALRATDDFLDGQVMYFKTAIDGHAGQIKGLDGRVTTLEGTIKQAPWLTAVAEADKRREAGDLAVAAAASKEVKELADILKADYGKQVGGVQADVDALWLDMIAGDEALQKQIDAINGATCDVTSLSIAMYEGDDLAAAEAHLRMKRADFCGTGDPVTTP